MRELAGAWHRAPQKLFKRISLRGKSGFRIACLCLWQWKNNLEFNLSWIFCCFFFFSAHRNHNPQFWIRIGEFGNRIRQLTSMFCCRFCLLVFVTLLFLGGSAPGLCAAKLNLKCRELAAGLVSEESRESANKMAFPHFPLSTFHSPFAGNDPRVGLSPNFCHCGWVGKKFAQDLRNFL